MISVMYELFPVIVSLIFGFCLGRLQRLLRNRRRVISALLQMSQIPGLIAEPDLFCSF